MVLELIDATGFFICFVLGTFVPLKIQTMYACSLSSNHMPCAGFSLVKEVNSIREFIALYSVYSSRASFFLLPCVYSFRASSHCGRER